MAGSTPASWRICASSLVALAVTAGLAACGSTTGDEARPRPAALPTAPRALARLTSVQREDFALLRTRPEGLPAHTRRLAGGRAAGVNTALAQRIPVLVPGSYWLVPGIGQLCLVSEVPGTPGVRTICARTRQVLREGLATISLTAAEGSPAGAPARLVVGIAPDDAREALLHTHGSIAATPIVRGVFVLRDAVRAPSDFIELRGSTRTKGTHG